MTICGSTCDWRSDFNNEGTSFTWLKQSLYRFIQLLNSSWRFQESRKEKLSCRIQELMAWGSNCILFINTAKLPCILRCSISWQPKWEPVAPVASAHLCGSAISLGQWSHWQLPWLFYSCFSSGQPALRRIVEWSGFFSVLLINANSFFLRSKSWEVILATSATFRRWDIRWRFLLRNFIEFCGWRTVSRFWSVSRCTEISGFESLIHIHDNAFRCLLTSLIDLLQVLLGA